MNAPKNQAIATAFLVFLQIHLFKVANRNRTIA